MADDCAPRHVHLRPLRDFDEGDWCVLHRDPQAMARIVAPLSDDASRRSFAAALAGNRRVPPRRRTWVVETDGRFAGVIGLVFDAPGAAELGAILVPPAQGRGIATRALALLVEHAFADLALVRVHTRHDADHAGAAALMRTLGFRRTAADLGDKGWRWACASPPVRSHAGDSLQAIG